MLAADPCRTSAGDLRRMGPQPIPAPPDDEGPIFGLIEAYVVGKRRRGEWSKVTARNERYTLLDFGRSFGRRPIARLGPSDIDRWLRQGRYQPATQRLRLCVVRRFTTWLVMQRKIRRDPCLGFKLVPKPRKVPVVFSRDEIADILDQCPDPRARVIVLLTVQAGLRCVEISRLELGDIVGTVALVRGKFGHEREVHLAAELRDALAAYLAERGMRAGPLVVSYARPAPLLPSTIGSMFSRWSRLAGVKRRAYDGKTAHGGRRTCATDMLELGAPIEVVAEFLGHDDLSTIRDYAKVNAKRFQPAVEGRWYGRRVFAIKDTA
jgi:integrase